MRHLNIGARTDLEGIPHRPEHIRRHKKMKEKQGVKTNNAPTRTCAECRTTESKMLKSKTNIGKFEQNIQKICHTRQPRLCALLNTTDFTHRKLF